MRKMKLMEKSILLALILTLLLTMTGFSATCEQISTKVFRLHIMANSDSTEDQQLKLQVRDAILEQTKGMFDFAQSREEAMQLTREQLETIEHIAEAEIRRQGYSYTVHAEVTNMYFNTRQYETITLPAGNYDTLRVTIGSGEGKNWWCVLFPPMCLPVAQEHAGEEHKEIGDVLDESQLEVVENGDEYEVRFILVEWYEQIKSWLCGE